MISPADQFSVTPERAQLRRVGWILSRDHEGVLMGLRPIKANEDMEGERPRPRPTPRRLIGKTESRRVQADTCRVRPARVAAEHAELWTD